MAGVMAGDPTHLLIVRVADEDPAGGSAEARVWFDREPDGEAVDQIRGAVRRVFVQSFGDPPVRCADAILPYVNELDADGSAAGADVAAAERTGPAGESLDALLRLVAVDGFWAWFAYSDAALTGYLVKVAFDGALVGDADELGRVVARRVTLATFESLVARGGGRMYR